MASRPEVRAFCSQEALSVLAAEQPEQERQIRAAVPPESLEAIETAGRGDWIPLEHDREFVHAMLEVLGEEATTQRWRSLLEALVQAPWIRTAVSAGIRLFGLSPTTMVRITPRVAPLVYRDFFLVRASLLQRDHAQLLFDEIHPDVLETPAYFTAIRGFLAGYFDTCHVEGQIEFELEPQRRVARVHLRWDPNSTPEG